MISLIQANLNSSWDTQDLLMQTVRERGIDVAIVSEHKATSSNPRWTISSNGTCAVELVGQPSLTPIAQVRLG